MGILDKIINGLSGKMENKSIFMKDFSEEGAHIEGLENLLKVVTDDKKRSLIQRDIAYLKKGLNGEKNTYYELKNSFLPIVCLHDIRLDYDGYVAQFDFIVMCKGGIYILESKKLEGDIKVHKNGEFIRNVNGKYMGMYSPVVQNKRHKDILSHMIKKEFKRDIPIGSIVVMANERAIINMKYAPDEVKRVVIKRDALVERIKEGCNGRKFLSEDDMMNIGQWLLNNNKPINYDYENKYGIENDEAAVENEIVSENINEENNHESIRENLKSYRLRKSKEENVKAYFIFNNEQMEELINRKPKSIEELLDIKGFGQVKCEKYGGDIIEVLQEN